MKKFSIWLARQTGAYKHIHQQAEMDVAYRLTSASYWFSNKDRIKAANALALCSLCLRGGYGINAEKIRDFVDKCGEDYWDVSPFKEEILAHWHPNN